MKYFNDVNFSDLTFKNIISTHVDFGHFWCSGQLLNVSLKFWILLTFETLENDAATFLHFIFYIVPRFDQPRLRLLWINH